MSSEYYFGNCQVCNKWKALKDGICNWCAEDSVPGFLQDLFRDKPKEENNNDEER